jgi:hypothetical protein
MKCSKYKHIDSVLNDIAVCIRNVKFADAYMQRNEQNCSAIACRDLARCAKLLKLCDSLIFDSRLKRSKKPGRATNWEIRTVLGLPENIQISSKYTGRVGSDGSVVVFDRITNKPVGSMTGEQLDQLALNSRLNIKPPSGNTFNTSYTFGNYGNTNSTTTNGAMQTANVIDKLAVVLKNVSTIIMSLSALGVAAAGIKSTATALKNKISEKISSMRNKS